MRRKTRSRSTALLGVFAIVLGTLLTYGGLTPSPAGADTPATLNPDHVGATNPGFQEGDCPEPPDPTKTWGWHFVLQGSETTFVTLTATFENEGVVTEFISHPDAKHAYVYTSGPDTLLSATATVDGPDTTFNLSHVCPGEETGSLKVKKVLSGATEGYVAGSEFTFDVDCDDDAFDQTVTLEAGENQVISGIPVGTECTVTETNIPDAADGYEYGTPTFDPASGTVTITTAGATVTVTVTNVLSEVTPQTGSLKVKKVLSGATEGYVAGSEFTFDVDCDDDAFDQTVTLEAGENQVISGIPVGTECTVTETDLPDAAAGYQYGDPVFDPADGTVTITTAGATVKVTVTNVLSELPPETGSLKIEKLLTGPTQGYDPGSEFTFDVDCDDDSFDQTVTLAANQDEVISGIPLGTVCTVTETNIPDALAGFEYGDPTYDPADGTVTITEADATVTVTVTNRLVRQKGSIEVTKALSGATEGYVAGSEFEFSLDCPGMGHDETFSLEAGGTATFDDIPVGVLCTVTETSIPDAAEGYEYGDPVLDPADGQVTITEEGATVTVTVTNVLNEVVPQVGSIEVTKALSGATEGYVAGSEFEFSLDCDDDSFDQTFSLIAGGTETISGIPLGTVCTVEEINLPDAADGFVYGTPTLDPADGTVTITTAGVTVTVTVTNTLEGVSPQTTERTPTSQQPTGGQGATVAPNGVQVAGIQQVPQSGQLPRTGTNPTIMLVFGAALVGGGLFLVAQSRRRTA